MPHPEEDVTPVLALSAVSTSRSLVIPRASYMVWAVQASSGL